MPAPANIGPGTLSVEVPTRRELDRVIVCETLLRLTVQVDSVRPVRLSVPPPLNIVPIDPPESSCG